MINQVIPFMEMRVENDPSGECLNKPVCDFPACFVNLVYHSGEDFQPCQGHGLRSPLAGIVDGDKRGTAPRACYLREEHVFDWVVLGAVGRVMHDDNLHPDSVCKANEVLLDNTVGAGVGAAAIAEYNQHPGIGIDAAKVFSPAGFDVVTDKLGGVVAGADGEVSGVVGDVVDSVWDDDSVGKSGEVVVEGLRSCSAEHGAMPLEVADKFLLLGVDADDRNAGFDTHPLDHPDFLELLVPSLGFAHRDVLAERPRLESALPDESADVVFGDVNPALEKLTPDSGRIDVEPDDVLVHRVSGHMLGHYLQEALLPFRVLGDFVLRSASRLADSAFAGARFLPKFTNSLANRLCGNVEKLAQRLYRKAVGPDRLARNKKPSLPFIKCHKERYFLFIKPYWGFLLQSCNCLELKYKDTKISPVIYYLNC